MIEFKYNSPVFKLGKISRSEWRDLGMSARSEIVKRTRSGIDINHQPFHEYSAATQEYKSGIMQTRGLGSSVVTLQDTGQMHRSLSVEVQANAAILYLSLIHISEPTRLLSISYAVFCLKKKKTNHTTQGTKLI